MDAQKITPASARIRRCFLKENGRPTRTLWTLSFFACYLALAGLVMPRVLRTALETRMARTLNSPCRVESLSFNPFTLKLTASNISVPYPGDAGMFLRLERLELTPSFFSLFRLAPGIKELKLDSPVIDLILLKNGELSPHLFFDGRNGGPAEPVAPAGWDKAVFPCIIYDFSINNGTLTFRDQRRNATQLVKNINLFVPFASSLPGDEDLPIRPQLNAEVNGRRMSFAGETRPFSNSLSTEFTLLTEELELDSFREYIAPYTPLDLKSGALMASLKLRLSREEGKPVNFVLTGKAEIANLELAGPQGAAFKAARLGAALEEVRFDIQRIAVSEVFLDAPAVTVRRAADGTVDWGNFFIPPKKDAPDDARQEAAASPWTLIVTRAGADDGAVTWHDAGVPGFARHTVHNIRATLADLSSEGAGKTDFSLEFGEGPSKFTCAGKAAFRPLRINGAVNMEHMPLAPFAGYFAQAAGISLDSGALGLKGEFSVEQGAKMLVRFNPAEIRLSDASLSALGRKTPLLTARHLTVNDITADLSEKRLNVGKISGAGIHAYPVRGKNGVFAVSEAASAVPAAAKNDNAQPASGMDWKATLGSAQFDSADITLTDYSPRAAAVLPFSEIKLAVSDLSAQPGKQWSANVSTRPGKRGTVHLDAKGTLQPLAVSFRFKADKADLAFLSPYLEERAELALSEGDLNADVTGEIKSGKGDEMEIAADGDAGLHGVSLAEGGKEIGGWGRLRAEKFRYRSAPGSAGALSIGSLILNGPRIAVTIGNDGTSNIQRVLRLTPAKTASATPAAPRSAPPALEPPVRQAGAFSSLSIGGVRISGGEIRLRDERLQPPHFLKADDIRMNAKQLSSEPASRGEFEGGFRLRGSPVVFSGKINPLIALPAGTFKVEVKPFDLTTLSRYSAKFTGYPIRKGELSAKINAALDGLKLDSRNDLIIRKLELGEKDRTSDAPDMPVKMAVSLLSDLNGNISLSLPVSGRLDDPQFRMGGVLGKVMANIMLKTVTSPISLLGGVFNLFTGAGGMDLERIAFLPGEDRLDRRARDALRALAQALAKRPSIKLELIGVADMLEKADIASADILKAMREIKYKSLPGAEREGTTPDRMRVGPDVDAAEYERLLSQVYAAGRFAKPERGAEGLSTREMMRRLRNNASISDAQVSRLADARAAAVRDELAKIDESLANRISISPSRITSDAGTERKADAFVLTKMQ